MATTTTYVRETFQMLWDCPACGTRKLLGVDHRHCPQCGHPQDHERRYFPKPGERVPTAYRGATPDRICSSCSTACGARDANCMACGAPLAGAQAVHVRRSIDPSSGEDGARARADHEARKAARRDQQAAAHRARPQLRPSIDDRRTTASEPISRVTLRELELDDLEPLPRREPWRWVVGAVAVLLVLVVVALVWKRDATLEVAGHRWERAIEVERFTAAPDDAWCSSMPADAYHVTRRTELHHTDQVPDGQVCQTVPGSCSETCSARDNGNGSASTVCSRTCSPPRQDCQTRYRSQPVYAERCYFMLDRWRHARTASASGEALEPAPAWPTPTIRTCERKALGCERLGDRAQTYVVRLQEGGEFHECKYPQARWASLAKGQSVRGEVGVLTGSLDCDTVGEP